MTKTNGVEWTISQVTTYEMNLIILGILLKKWNHMEWNSNFILILYSCFYIFYNFPLFFLVIFFFIWVYFPKRYVPTSKQEVRIGREGIQGGHSMSGVTSKQVCAKLKRAIPRPHTIIPATRSSTPSRVVQGGNKYLKKSIGFIYHRYGKTRTKCFFPSKFSSESQ